MRNQSALNLIDLHRAILSVNRRIVKYLSQRVFSRPAGSGHPTIVLQKNKLAICGLLKRGRCWRLVRRFGLADDLMTTPFDPQALEHSAIFLCFRANHKDSLK